MSFPPIIQHDAFACFPEIYHGFTTRALAFPPFYWPSTKPDRPVHDVHKNRQALMEYTGFAPDALAPMEQVHGNNVLLRTAPIDQGKIEEADAQITATPGILLGVITADCVPVLLYDPIAKVVGAVHSGWRSTLAGVLPNTLRMMQENGAMPAHIHALIGPCIHQASYEVGPEVYALFVAHNPEYAAAFVPSGRAEHWLFDLRWGIHSQLRAAGIHHVHAVEEDTYAHPEKWYSFRLSTHQKAPYPGNILSMIGLRA
jgi:YfiH family protein